MLLIISYTVSYAQTLSKFEKAVFRYDRFMINHIGGALHLNGERLDRFDEIYTAYLKEAKETRGNDRTQLDIKDLPTMTDVEIEQKIITAFDLSHRNIAVRERYFKIFREVLSAREVAMMYELEKKGREKFAEELQRRLLEKAEEAN